MTDITFIGLAIILAGFLVVFMAMVTSAKKSEDGEKRTLKGGGVIMIGPIPIIFGSDARWAGIAIALAIVLIVFVVVSGVLIR